MRVLAFAAGLVLLWVAPLVLPLGDYTHNIIGLTFMFMAAALAWNWLGGYVGQISFGHAAMFGVGGFVAARLILTPGWPFWLAWIAGGLVAGSYALLWGHPTLRLRGPYFSIATIGVGEATRLVATYWSDFTGGSSGLSLPLGAGARPSTSSTGTACTCWPPRSQCRTGCAAPESAWPCPRSRRTSRRPVTSG